MSPVTVNIARREYGFTARVWAVIMLITFVTCALGGDYGVALFYAVLATVAAGVAVRDDRRRTRQIAKANDLADRLNEDVTSDVPVTIAGVSAR